MSNLSAGTVQREFWVWIDPNEFLVRHNIRCTGGFSSVPVDDESPNLMFLPNPEFKTFVGPFQNNLLRHYIADYNLELARAANHPQYPSRMRCVFLLNSEADARDYASRHSEHTRGRALNKVHTVGAYKYSIHDAGWVDFLRLGLSFDPPTLAAVGNAYWSGQYVDGAGLQAMGRSWSQPVCREVLFSGRVVFEDSALNV